jgi:hypothetical protein
MKKTIMDLLTLLNPIGFTFNKNTLVGPEGVIIEYMNKQKNLFLIKKYPHKDHTGRPVLWGAKEGLQYEEALLVLRQIFLDIEW